MEPLSYDLLARQGYGGYLLRDAPERVLQFGEGNFLRAFAEDFIDTMNEKAGFAAKVVLVKPGSPRPAPLFAAQQGLYTLLLRGREGGRPVARQRVISCVSRCINPYTDYGALLACARQPALRFLISNTTEAGIVFDPACRADDAPPASFPGKLTAFLYARYQAGLPGFIILSCELIDDNGAALQRCVQQYVQLWGLGAEFAAWVDRENLFCTTVVDRIVTGYPAAEAEALSARLGYTDGLLDAGEVYASWIIQGPASIADELPFRQAGLPIRLVEDAAPYKRRKVRILNGAHTSLAMAAYLAGQDIVRDCMTDPLLRPYLDGCIYNEILPTLDLPRADLEAFAAAVADRFANPYIDHSLLAIALNSTAKWKARVLPSVAAYYQKTGRLPRLLTFSFAAYLAFYSADLRREADGGLTGGRDGARYPIRDDGWVLDFFYAHRADDAAALTAAVAADPRLWDGALAALPGFAAAAAADLARIRAVGLRAALEACLAEAGAAPAEGGGRT